MIVINGTIYFDKLYKKYKHFRKDFYENISGEKNFIDRSKSQEKVFLLNPIANSLDYILFSMVNLNNLLKKYSRKFIYFNVKHRLNVFHKNNINDLIRKFKRLIGFIPDVELISYEKYHEFFKNYKNYRYNNLSERKLLYDYDNEKSLREKEFFLELIKHQNYLTEKDLFYCNLLILSCLKNTTVIYTTTNNIDYRKYLNAKIVPKRSKKHRYYYNENIYEKHINLTDFYTHFKREIPIIDYSQVNNYDFFVLNTPIDLYINNFNNVILDGINDILIEDIVEINETDINSLINFIKEKYQPYFTEIDLNLLK